MQTDPNPQHLLRRPKKVEKKSGNVAFVAGGVGGGVLVVAAIAAFVVFGHGRTPARASAPSQTQVSTVPVMQTVSEPVVHETTAHHAAHKASVKPDGGASPTPAASPTPTPEPTTTPAADQALTAAAAAKARHEAALHQAALRRLEAAQSASQSTVAQVQHVSPAASQPNPAPVTPAQTQAPAPAATTADATSLYAPRVVVDARFIDRVSPTYPDIAKEQGAAGTAIVLATVGPSGNVISVAIDQSTGNRMLDEAALSAARSSRFEPPEIDGKPATETYRIVYTFDPNG